MLVAMLFEKLASSIFRCPERNFAHISQNVADLHEILVDVRNFQRKFGEFSTNFDEQKARISSKFALITFAQYGSTLLLLSSIFL